MPRPPATASISAQSSAMPTAPAPAGPLRVRDDVAVDAIGKAEWDALARGRPLVSHAFLTALHETGCASTATGWTPRYLTAWRGAALAGALPLYAKAHSYGEYVFDWAWADAYRRHGRRYYPKLVAAVPFTPAPGARLLGSDDEARAALIVAALGLLRPARSCDPPALAASSANSPAALPAGERNSRSGAALQRSSGAPGYSSLHVLFPDDDDARALADAGMVIRHGLQFRWENHGYRDFADFLATFNHDKRKKVKQERRKVAAAGVDFVRKVGDEITAADWAFFHGCYVGTYRDHRSTPYLTLEFFERIGAAMPANVMMALGRRNGTAVCAALDLFDGDTLWGRYWGTTEPVSGLHFEACYYQAIEFCIERGIARFEGGAQGVHKLARGLVPVTTWSAHAIADPDFAGAIADFCMRERVDVAHAADELSAAGPFRTPERPGATGDSAC